MLLLMPTDRPKSRGLSPFFRLIPFTQSRRNSKAPTPEDSNLSPESYLSPRRTSKSSNSEESRSIRSTSSRGRKLIRVAFSKIRSPSILSKGGLPATTDAVRVADFEAAQDWLSGFEKYNRFITNQFPEIESEKYSTICATLTSQCGGVFFHGLPERMIDSALLWCPSTELHRRAGTSEPSWSWTGWEAKAAKELPVNFPFDHTSCPDVRSQPGACFKSEIKDFYLQPPDVGFKDVPKIKDATEFKNEASLSTFCKFQRQTNGVRIELPTKYYVPRQKTPQESKTLHFKAYTIPATGFRLEQMKYHDERNMPVCELFDENDKQCGVIMDYEEPLTRVIKDPGPPHKSATGPLDFVFISRNRQCSPNENYTRPATNTTHPPGTPIWQDGRYLWDQQIHDYDETSYKAGEWNVYNIMLIQWLSEGHAERVAIGRIHKDAWEARNPTWEHIILE